MNRLFRVQHRKVNAGQYYLRLNKLIQADSAVEALYLASGNTLLVESSLVNMESAVVERLVDGAQDTWFAVRE